MALPKSKVAALLLLGAAVLLLGAGIGTVVLVRAKSRAESAQCGNLVVTICIAARTWASDNNGAFPSDFRSMSNELNHPFILICPGDRTRRTAADWNSLTDAKSSYEIVNTKLHEGDSNAVFIRCKVHGHLGYADGTVFDGERRRTKLFSQD